MASQINGTDIQAIYQMSTEIKKYAESLQADFIHLMSKHQQMHNHWSGNQYDDLTAILDNARQKIDLQVERLKEIAKAVQTDAELLAEANNFKLRS